MKCTAKRNEKLWQLDLQLPVQSVPITTKVVSSNPVQGEVYSIQQQVIKFVSDIATGQWFFPCTLVSSTNKTDCHNITEILLEVALNTINQPTYIYIYIYYCRYSIIAFLKPLSQVEVDPNVCRHILKYAGIKNCEIGKSRVS